MGIYYVVSTDGRVVVRTNVKPTSPPFQQFVDRCEKLHQQIDAEHTRFLEVWGDCLPLSFLSREEGRGFPPKSDISLLQLKLLVWHLWTKAQVGYHSESTLPATKAEDNRNGWPWVKWEGNPKFQPTEAPKDKGINCPILMGETQATYTNKLYPQSKIYDPGYELFEKIQELGRQLKAKQNNLF